MKTLLSICCGLALCFAQPSFAQKAYTDTVAVAPYLQLSYGAFFKSLALKTDHPSIDHIEGFDFEWGMAATLTVAHRKLAQPPADASAYSTQLIEVLSIETVAPDFNFALRLEPDLYLGLGEQASTLQAIDDNTYRYFNEVSIEVPGHLKLEFEAMLDDKQPRTGRFVFAESAQTITLTGWE